MMVTMVKRVDGLLFGFGLLIGILLEILILSYFNSLKYEENSFKSDFNTKKKLLLIGVMTSKKFLETRGKEIFNTWANHSEVNLIFFSSSNSQTSLNLHLVSLPNVNKSNTLQKKSLMILKHMHDYYLGKFEWFMSFDDDVYLDMDKLEIFLRSLDSTKKFLIGQHGSGNISLENEKNYCIGGTGILMTASVLESLVHNIPKCLKNISTINEDVEIARCVKHFVNISSTYSSEVS